MFMESISSLKQLNKFTFNNNERFHFKRRCVNLIHFCVFFLFLCSSYFCQSIKGMEDEICPYATFHLLGFREEMDPTKAMNFQTFPHQNGNATPGHTGTMGTGPSNAHMHSRTGSQSMVSSIRFIRYGRRHIHIPNNFLTQTFGFATPESICS